MTCRANSSRTLQKKFVPLTIDCFAIIESPSLKNTNKTDTNIEECSIAFKPISSIALPPHRMKLEQKLRTTQSAPGSYMINQVVAFKQKFELTCKYSVSKILRHPNR